jgi:hypothetical protein
MLAAAPDILDHITSGTTSLSGTLAGMGGSAFSMPSIIANLLFSAIGFVAFVYGRKMSALRPALLGVALMGYPWFVGDPWLMWGIGTVLTAALFIWRD